MTKYIAYKIFDSKDHGEDIDAILSKMKTKYFAVVHEDYAIPVIQEDLKNEGI